MKNTKYESGLISDILNYIDFYKKCFGITPKHIDLPLDFFVKYTTQDRLDYNELVMFDSFKKGGNEYIFDMKVGWI